MSAISVCVVILWAFSYYFEIAKAMDTCTESTAGIEWRIVHNETHSLGQSLLMIVIDKEYPNGQYLVVLGCEGVIVRGGGMMTMELNRMKHGIVYYNLDIPMGNMEDAYSVNPKFHKCVVELKRKSMEDSQIKVVMECSLVIKVVMRRIVPHCDEVGDTLVKEVNMKDWPGNVRVLFKRSSHDVANITRECKNMESLDGGNDYDIFGLTSIGGERIFTVDFYPDCDNLEEKYHSLVEAHKDHRPDCFLIIHAICQEGLKLQGSYHVEMEPGAFNCPKPKSSFILFLEWVKLLIKIESDAIAFLMVTLAFIIFLYLLLLPCLVTTCFINSEKYAWMLLHRLKAIKKRIIKHGRKRSSHTLPSSKVKSHTSRMYDDGDVYLVYEATTTTDVRKTTTTSKQDGTTVSVKESKKIHHGEKLKQKEHKRGRGKARATKIKRLEDLKKKTKHQQQESTKMRSSSMKEAPAATCSSAVLIEPSLEAPVPPPIQGILLKEPSREAPVPPPIQGRLLKEPSREAPVPPVPPPIQGRLLKEPSREAPVPPQIQGRLLMGMDQHGRYFPVHKEECPTATVSKQVSSPIEVVLSSSFTSKPPVLPSFHDQVTEPPKMEKSIQKDEWSEEDEILQVYPASDDTSEEEFTVTTESGYVKMLPIKAPINWHYGHSSPIVFKHSADESEASPSQHSQTEDQLQEDIIVEEIVSDEVPIIEETLHSQITDYTLSEERGSNSEERESVFVSAVSLTPGLKQADKIASTMSLDGLWADKFTNLQLIAIIQKFLKDLDSTLPDEVINSFTVNLDKLEAINAIELFIAEVDVVFTDSESAIVKEIDPDKILAGVDIFLHELDQSLSAKSTTEGYMRDKNNRTELLGQQEWNFEKLEDAYISLLDQIKGPVFMRSVSKLEQKASSTVRTEGSQATRETSRRSLLEIHPSLLKRAVHSFLKDLDPVLSEDSLAFFLDNLDTSKLVDAVDSFLDELGVQLGMSHVEKLDSSLSNQAIGTLLLKLDSKSEASEENMKDELENEVKKLSHSSSIYLHDQRILLLQQLDEEYSKRVVNAFVNQIDSLRSSRSDIYYGRMRHVSGISMCSPSYSAPNVKIQHEFLQNSEGRVDKTSLRDSASAIAIEIEKLGFETEVSIDREQETHKQESLEDLSRHDTNSSSDDFYPQPGDSKPPIELSQYQKKSRKIYKKPSNESRKSTEQLSLDQYADEQIKHFVESSSKITGKPSSSTRESFQSDDYTSALSKHSSDSLKRLSSTASGAAITSKSSEQKKQQYARVVPFQPDSSVKYTLVRRHTLGGTEVSASIPSTVQSPSVQLQEDNLQMSSWDHFTSTQLDQHNKESKGTQSPRQIYSNKSTQSPERSVKGTQSPTQEYFTQVNLSPTPEDQFFADSHSPRLIEEVSSHGFDQWLRENQFARLKQLSGGKHASLRPRTKSGPSMDRPNKGMDEDIALQRFFKYHRRSQDSQHSFANSLTNSECDDHTGSQLPELSVSEVDRPTMQHPPLPLSLSKEHVGSIHQTPTPHLHYNESDCDGQPEKKEQEAVHEKKQSLTGQNTGSTTRKIKRKKSGDELRQTELFLQSVQQRQLFSTPNHIQREFVSLHSPSDDKELDKKQTEINTATDSEVDNEEQYTTERNDLNPALPFHGVETNTSNSRESELSFQSVLQHAINDSSYPQKEYAPLESSGEAELEMSERETTKPILSSSYPNDSKLLGGESTSIIKTSPNTSSQEHSKFEDGREFVKEMKSMIQSSSYTTDENVPLQKLSYLKENVKYQSSSSALEPNVHLSSMMGTDSSPLLQEQSTTFQSSSVTDQHQVPGGLMYQSTTLQSSSTFSEQLATGNDTSVIEGHSTSFQTSSPLLEEPHISVSSYSYEKRIDLSPERPHHESGSVRYSAPEKLFVSGPSSSKNNVPLYAHEPSTSKKGKKKSFTPWKREHSLDENKEPTSHRHQFLRLLRRGRIQPLHRRAESAGLEERKELLRSKPRSKSKTVPYKEKYKQHYSDSDEREYEFRRHTFY